MVGSNFTPPPPPCWFSLNNSETVEAVTLAFWSIQQHFIRDVRTDFLGKTQTGVFLISGFLVSPL